MKTRRAFTLIELLIVITIIGILAVSFAPRLLGAPSQARDAKRVEDINTIAGAFAAAADGKALFGSSWIRCASTTNLDPSDFGGTLPADPMHQDLIDWWLYGTLCDQGNGSYLIIDLVNAPVLANPNGDYRFSVFGGVENIENANTDCTFTALVSAQGFEGPTEDYAEGNCYVQYVQ